MHAKRRHFRPVHLFRRSGLAAAFLTTTVGAGCAVDRTADRAVVQSKRDDVPAMVAAEDARLDVNDPVELVGFQDEPVGEAEQLDLLFPEEPTSPSAEDLMPRPLDEGDVTADALPTPADVVGPNASGERAVGSIDTDPTLAEGESSNPPKTSVGTLVAEAVARSPRVLAARHRAAAAERQIPQVTSYQNPELGTTYAPIDSNSLQTAGGRVPLQIQLTQKMPWRTKLDTRGAIAWEEAKRLRELAAEAELQVAYDVRTAAADLWYADRAIEIAEADRELLSSIEEVAKARVRSGASQQDVLAARLESDRLDDRIASLRRVRGVAIAELASLLGQSIASVETIAIEIPTIDAAADVDRLINDAIACRPELRSQLFAITRDRQKRRLACLERYPDFNVGLGWQSVTEQEAISPVANGNDNINLIVGVSLPVWHDRINAGIREADQQIYASSREYDASVDQLRRDVGSAVVRLETLSDQQELFEKTLIPRAQQTLEISLADYRGGKVTFVQLTQNYLSVLALQTEAARLQSERAKAYAALSRAVGCEIAGVTLLPPCP